MQTYEIRILKDDLSTRSVIDKQYMNDGAAIRSARYVAEPRPFEVWRGLSCVLGRSSKLPPLSSLPDSPGL
jgi:hypothetical protein